ncbi:vegetative cell wall protein gp1-like [Eucalyptus grandis]|uniref:vegetative cell wall protein gp1-like n=1 Tax=Eucalyptus grandis TaxID=71139 RepID=UPI00192E9C48|nr:vegetative cell wall protein gp1-like [Eucalyptus grandis]
MEREEGGHGAAHRRPSRRLLARRHQAALLLEPEAVRAARTRDAKCRPARSLAFDLQIPRSSNPPPHRQDSCKPEAPPLVETPLPSPPRLRRPPDPLRASSERSYLRSLPATPPVPLDHNPTPLCSASSLHSLARAPRSASTAPPTARLRRSPPLKPRTARASAPAVLPLRRQPYLFALAASDNASPPPRASKSASEAPAARSPRAPFAAARRHSPHRRPYDAANTSARPSFVARLPHCRGRPRSPHHLRPVHATPSIPSRHQRHAPLLPVPPPPAAPPPSPPSLPGVGAAKKPW